MNPRPATLDGVLGPDGTLYRDGPFRYRPFQHEVARTIDRALAAGGRLVVEAGTGTGKTVAYLVPLLLSEGRGVVSTATKGLQEQVAGKDLPALAPLTGARSVAVLKGRANYLCRRRLNDLLLRGPSAGLFDGSAPVGGTIDKLAAWAERTDSGDLDEAAGFRLGDELRASVSARREGCSGRHCACFRDCLLYRARERAREADLAVVNHHLLLADLAGADDGAGGLVPATGGLVLDEAHTLERIATEQFGLRAGLSDFHYLARDLELALAARRLIDAAALSAFRSALPPVETAFEAINVRVRALARGGSDAGGRVALERCLDYDSLALVHGAVEGFERLLLPLADAVGEEERESYAGRLARLCADTRTILAGEAGPDRVCYAESGARHAVLRGDPVEVGPLLRERLFCREGGVVLLSATIRTTGDGCRPFAAGIGLEGYEYTEHATPFDLARNMAVFIPADLPPPDDPAFREAAAGKAVALIRLIGGRSLVLSTSHSGLRDLAARVRQGIGSDFPVLVQGEGPAGRLLDRFRREVSSVLIGTRTFWEGVDVAGESLQAVIIDKIPFAPPDDPLVEARSARMRERGEDPFLLWHLPQAILALRQGAGRLLRSEGDTGIIALLDSRVHRRGYGRRVAAALAAGGAPLFGTEEQLRAWVAERIVPGRKSGPKEAPARPGGAGKRPRRRKEKAIAKGSD